MFRLCVSVAQRWEQKANAEAANGVIGELDLQQVPGVDELRRAQLDRRQCVDDRGLSCFFLCFLDRTTFGNRIDDGRLGGGRERRLFANRRAAEWPIWARDGKNSFGSDQELAAEGRALGNGGERSDTLDWGDYGVVGITDTARADLEERSFSINRRVGMD